MLLDNAQNISKSADLLCFEADKYDNGQNIGKNLQI